MGIGAIAGAQMLLAKVIFYKPADQAPMADGDPTAEDHPEHPAPTRRPLPVAP